MTLSSAFPELLENSRSKHILSIITGKNNIQKLDVGYRKNASKQQGYRSYNMTHIIDS